MFARHTPTRMKGTGIVQGLKSWASALHPQLPLSRKESQRLLTALTSSFRRQLDEVHPPHSSNDGRPQLEGANDAGAKPERSQGLHSSSAAYADRHLASVLTNPLLAQGKVAKKPDVATVLVELQRNPAKDPIELLEEYHERGHATIPIALTCLEAFKKSLDALDESQRKVTIRETAAGKRTLLWIWRNKVYESEQFVREPQLADLMVSFVCEEGFEKYLWDWLDLDIAIDSQKLADTVDRNKAKQHPYRWKGLVVRGIVDAKVYNALSFDSAIATFLRARELKKSDCIPFAAAKVALSRAIRHHPGPRYSTDPSLYDRWISAIKGRSLKSNVAIAELDICTMHSIHPTCPSPFPTLRLLQKVFREQLNEWQTAGGYLRDSRDKVSRQRWYRLFKRTVFQLEDRECREDAQWVREITVSLYPEFADKVERHVAEDRMQDIEERRRFGKNEVEGPRRPEQPEKLPMPSFAI